MFSIAIRTVLIAASLYAAFDAPAEAQTAQSSYHPYELATVEGQRAVLNRIGRAARHACEPDRRLSSYLESKLCVAELTAQMISNSDSPTLIAMWKGGNVQMASRTR